MSSDKNIQSGDAGYIGEELLIGTSELNSKCLVIQRTVADGDFSLEEALGLYEVSPEEYQAFLVRNLFDDFETAVSSLVTIAKTDQSSQRLLIIIELVDKTYKKFVSPVDMKSGIVIRHLEDLSKKIKAGKVG